MKKAMKWIIAVTVILLCGAMVWRVAFETTKHTDSLPSLASVAEQGEVFAAEKTKGYRLERLTAVWGEPQAASVDGGPVWKLEDGRYLEVTVNEKGKITEARFTESPVLWDRCPMIRVDSALYFDTGKTMAGEVDPSAIVGKISSTVDQSQIPQEDGQSNFDYVGADYAKVEEGVVILIDGEWVLFEPETEPNEK